MKKINFSISILFSLFSSFQLFSQSFVLHQQANPGFVLPEIKIYQSEGRKNVIFHFENDYNLFSISNDTLIADPYKYNYRTSLSSVSAIGIRNGTYVASGMLYSSIFGFIAGFAYGWWKQLIPGYPHDIDFSECAVYGGIFALPFAFIGELLGFGSPYYDKIKLPKSGTIEKREAIIRIFSNRGYQFEMDGGK